MARIIGNENTRSNNSTNKKEYNKNLNDHKLSTFHLKEDHCQETNPPSP